MPNTYGPSPMEATPKPRAGEHTKGPWRVKLLAPNAADIGPQSDGVVAHVARWSSGVAGPEAENKANARRIVACVNACEGIDNKWLEDNAGMLQGHDHALERERDELKQQLTLFYERDPHKATSLVKINHELQQAKAEGDDLRQQIAFLEHFADPPDMRTGKTERQALKEKLERFVPLIEILTEKHWDYRTAGYIRALESAIKYTRTLLAKHGR